LQDGQVKCGFIRKSSWLAGTARSWASPQQIALQPNASSTAIAHELTHLLQENGVPHSEKVCDIWAVSRLAAEMVDEQPYYILRHKKSVRRLCVQAIEVRRTEVPMSSGCQGSYGN